MNKTIRGGARNIVYRVFLQCLAEFQAGTLLRNLEDIYQRTADYTERDDEQLKYLDDFDKCAIRQKIIFFLLCEKRNTYNIGYDGSREHLRRLLLNMGFSFKKCKTNRHALIEKSNIAHKRACYLHEIMKNRDLPEELQKDIIYLDESYIHSSYKVKKCWQSIETAGILTDISKGKRWILIHAGSEKGFVPNALVVFSGVNKQEDYHSEMNQKNFTKWVTEKLIPNITEPSIIVMDNAPYHSVIKNKAPTSANRETLAFDSITVQDWKNACEHIKKIEKEYYDRGRTLYDDIDQLVIQLGDDSSSSEDEYEYTNEKMLDDINVGASSSSDINVGASTSSQIEYLDFDLLD
ncbi:hypothetical protein ABMA27_007760 [Loxostege sticticalis]|uniref:Tc1-like transposase DDE domain-containing protein n=1 Tax=Loxostege sticticalis TaxID=481309 RepID=A0ABR3HCT7_LOXSC